MRRQVLGKVVPAQGPKMGEALMALPRRVVALSWLGKFIPEIMTGAGGGGGLRRAGLDDIRQYTSGRAFLKQGPNCHRR